MVCYFVILFLSYQVRLKIRRSWVDDISHWRSGAGFIGSHTALLLLNENNDIVIIDNFINSDPEIKKRLERLSNRSVQVYDFDVQNEVELEKLFVKYEFEAVIYFAGLKAVGESVEKPLVYYENNIVSTLTLLQVMERHGVTNFVFSSSATVYRFPKEVPIKENAVLYATNPYGRTKLIIEEILHDICVSNSN